jgi:hypothetical protein
MLYARYLNLYHIVTCHSTSNHHLDPFLKTRQRSEDMKVEQDDHDHQRATDATSLRYCYCDILFEITLYTSRMYLHLARYCSNQTPMFPPAGCFYASGFPAQATRPKLAVMALEYTARRPKTRLLAVNEAIPTDVHPEPVCATQPILPPAPGKKTKTKPALDADLEYHFVISTTRNR